MQKHNAFHPYDLKIVKFIDGEPTVVDKISSLSNTESEYSPGSPGSPQSNVPVLTQDQFTAGINNFNSSTSDMANETILEPADSNIKNLNQNLNKNNNVVIRQ